MKYFFWFILLVVVSVCHAQDTLSNANATGKIRIFLDCDECDFTFFRKNMHVVDFVRDPKLADIHILVTEQETAADGTEFGLNFIVTGQFSGLQYKLKTVSPESETDVLKWERLLKVINVGLLPYLAETAEIENVKIEFGETTNQALPTLDPWKFWVFKVESGLDYEAEESQKEYALGSSISADHITEKFKFKSEFGYQVNREIYKDDEETIENRQEETSLQTSVVYSLSSRWSVGFFADAYSSTYLNFKLGTEIGPAIEYNIFPWDKSDRKVFTIAYHLRSNYFNYNQKTIFGKTEEWKTTEALRLSLLLRQPWGEIENTLEGSHYFYNFSKNKLSLETEVSVKVFKGLSVYLELEAELVHDQLYLPAGEATRDEILLKQRKLATAFEVNGEMGIRFTFGSVYNNIVNQRL